jgi:hypothetical protein
MRWHEKDGIRWLEADLPGAKAVFSTRSGGSVKDDHAPLAAALGIAPGQIVASHQVHGTELAFHDSVAAAPAEADGHVIAEPGAAALVYVADCLPVALSGPRGAAILHCGWRGLARGIAARGAEAVAATHAAIGPGIGPCCYEVGSEVTGAFAAVAPGAASGRMLDLPEAARLLLHEAGVEEVESAGLCTCCDEELFFSHRRDGGSGRQAGLVWIERES